MPNEFGEDPTIYIWPLGHEDGEPFPEDFWSKLSSVLRSNGFDWEYT